MTNLSLEVELYQQQAHSFVLSVAKTTTYGLKSTCYIADKTWNSLPDNLRSVAKFARFRNVVKKAQELVIFIL